MTLSPRFAAIRFSRRSAGALVCAAALVVFVSACIDSSEPLTSHAPSRNRHEPATQQASSAATQSATYVSRLIGGPHDFSEGRADARSLCLICHTPEGMTDGAARLPRDQPPRAAAVLAQEGDRELDRHSLVCLGCHDGVIATDVFTTNHAGDLAGFAGSADAGTALAGHPIGGTYPAEHPRYRSANLVTRDGRIRLPGGRVQCVSCHDPHHAGGHPAMLVKSNERSALCLSCHRL